MEERATALITVVLPAFKMGAYIGAALESVAAQSYTRWEVVVVDDHAPEDGTATIVEAFAARVQQRVEFIRHEVNQGVSGARNTGIRAARGEFIAFLDPDDLFLPDHLRDAVNVLAGANAADVASGPVESFRDEPGRSWTHKAWLAGWRTDRFPHSLAVYNFLQPSATVVRRSALLAVGGFDTASEIQHIEDYDLWIRLVQAGHRFAFLPRISARYRKHAGGATSDDAKFDRLHAVLYAKHPDFFREGMRRMMRSAHEGLAREEALHRGPLMRSVLWMDDICLRGLRKLGFIKR